MVVDDEGGGGGDDGGGISNERNDLRASCADSKSKQVLTSLIQR